MKKLTVVLAMAIVAVTLLFSFASTASATDLSLPTLTLLQTAPADATAQPPVKQGSWGQLKTMYRSTTTPIEAVKADSTAASNRSQMVRPGAGTLAGTVANQQWWRSLSQAQRNEAICQEAYAEMTSLGGGYNKFSRSSGYNCKTWAQHVTIAASRGVASLPQSSSWCAWSYGQYVTMVGYGPAGAPIQGASRGNIVQASWGKYPHTMIIWSLDGNGVYVIDCNMDLNGGLEIHYITFTNFESTSHGCYTLYQVIGG